MSGAYFIECIDTQGEPHFTDDIDIAQDLDSDELADLMTDKCPFLKNAVVISGS